MARKANRREENSVFVDMSHQERGIRKAAEETIRICRERGVLAEYLAEREEEVIESLVMMYDQKTAVEQYGECRFQEGREEGRAEGVISTLTALVRDGILSVRDAAQRAGISEAAFQEKLTEQGIH